MGRTHAILGKSKNALALFSQALTLTSESAGPLSSSMDVEGPPRLDISPQQIHTLETTLRALVAQFRGLVTLENLSTEEQSKAGVQRPMVEQMHEYPGDELDLHNLVPYPPQLQPMPVKPLFLDVAWNYIDYPREGSTAAQPAVSEESGVEEKKGGRRGWFGFGR